MATPPSSDPFKMARKYYKMCHNSDRGECTLLFGLDGYVPLNRVWILGNLVPRVRSGYEISFQGLEALTGYTSYDQHCSILLAELYVYTVLLFGVLTLQQCKTLKKEGRGFRNIDQTFLALCTISWGTVLPRTCTQSSEVVSYHVFSRGERGTSL